MANLGVGPRQFEIGEPDQFHIGANSPASQTGPGLNEKCL
jgi:hypothetical protein